MNNAQLNLLSTLIMGILIVIVFSAFRNDRSQYRNPDYERISLEHFDVLYSEDMEQPVQVKYDVMCPDSNIRRGNYSFKKSPFIHTSDDDDYKNNVWDKGHMAPVQSLDCSDKMIRSTFTYLNCAMQHQTLNRGLWRELEEYENELASKYGEVSVIVRCTFHRDSLPTETGVTIPHSFVKEILFDDSLVVYEIPNSESVRGKKLEDFILQ